MKNVLSVIAGILVALAVSLATNPDGVNNALFRAGLIDPEASQEEITETINLFNAYFSSFFSTGGSLEGLGVFPAANLIKRWTVQEINTWKDEGKVLVYDKDRIEIESIELKGPRLAVAVTRELWFMSLQDLRTRERLSRVKANPIRVRYVLRKHGRGWRIEEYEVFDMKDQLPPLSMERFIK